MLIVCIGITVLITFFMLVYIIVDSSNGGAVLFRFYAVLVQTLLSPFELKSQ